jgi:hypothetical protein
VADTIYEILQQIGGQQKGAFGERSAKIGKVAAEDKAAITEAQIALEEELDKRKVELENLDRRTSSLRLAGQGLDFLTGTKLGTLLSNFGRERMKTKRFSLRGGHESVADPFRKLGLKSPDTTFYGSNVKRIESSQKSLSDWLKTTEEDFDRGMAPSLITDLITSHQREVAGFTPEYLKTIFTGVGEGKGFSEALKIAEKQRRGKLISEAKKELTSDVTGESPISAKSLRNIPGFKFDPIGKALSKSPLAKFKPFMAMGGSQTEDMNNQGKSDIDFRSIIQQFL